LSYGPMHQDELWLPNPFKLFCQGLSPAQTL